MAIKSFLTLALLGLWFAPISHTRPQTDVTDLTAAKVGMALIAYSPDGKTLAATFGGKQVRLWDVKTRAVQKTFNLPHNFTNAMVFAPTGHLLATAHSYGVNCGQVILWDTRTGKIKRRLTTGWQVGNRVLGDGHPVFVAFLPNSRIIAVGTDNETEENGHGEGSRVLLYDMQTGRLMRRLGSGTVLRYLPVFSADGRYLIMWAGERFLICDARTGRIQRTIKEIGNGEVQTLALSPNGRFLAAGGYADPYPGSGFVTVYRLDTGERVWTRKSLNAKGRINSIVEAVAFSPNSRTVAVAASFGVAYLCDTHTGELLQRFKKSYPAEFRSLSFSPDGHALAVGDNQLSAHVWHLH